MIEKGYIRLKATELEHHDHEGEMECCAYSYDFETIDGRFIEDICNDIDAPINRLLVVEIDDMHIVSWDFFDDGMPAPMVNSRVKDIALVKFNSPGYPVDEKDHEAVRKRANELENFLKQVNDGRWTFIRVTPYAIEGPSGIGFGLYYSFGNVKSEMEEQWPGRSDDHNYWHGWGGHKSGILGEAYVNSSKAWTYTGGQRTVNHEQGHSFGSGHSSTDGNEYGDPTCIMAKAFAGFNAPQMVKQKQIPVDEIVEVEPRNTYFLLPVECSHVDMRNGETRALQLGRYMLSTRKTKDQSDLGVRDMSYSESKNAIFYHFASSPHDLANPLYKGRILPGKSHDFDGTIVKNAEVEDDVIRVEVGNVTEQPDFPKPLKMASGDKLTTEHSALWHNPEYKHQGIDLFVIPDENRVMGYWYTYHARGEHTGQSFQDKKNGKEWFVLDGEIDSLTNVVSIVIIQTRNREQKVVGYGSMRLVDGQLMFRSYTENYGRDHMFLQPLTTPREEPTGIYESGEYEGFTISKYKDEDGNDIYTAYYYGYGAGDNLDWSIYIGSDPENLQGYKTSGKYKQTFENEIEEIAGTSISEIQTNTKIL